MHEEEHLDASIATGGCKSPAISVQCPISAPVPAIGTALLMNSAVQNQGYLSSSSGMAAKWAFHHSLACTFEQHSSSHEQHNHILCLDYKIIMLAVAGCGCKGAVHSNIVNLCDSLDLKIFCSK